MVKRVLNLLVIIIVGLLVVPSVVMAEGWRVGDVVYTYEEHEIADYLCEEVRDHELYASVYDRDGNLIVHDVYDNKDYLVDLTKAPACNVLENHHHDIYYSRELVWGKDNRLFMDTLDERKMFVLIKTSDEVVDVNKGYYELVTEEDENGEYSYFDRVGDAVDSEIASYYEMIYIKEATGEYDASKDYYRVDLDTGAAEEVEIDEEAYDAGEFYVFDGNIERELVAQFPSKNFVMPKEKTGLDIDVTFNEIDYPDYFVYNGKKYFAFNEWNDSLMRAVTGIFDDKGVYQTFGFDTLNLVSYEYGMNGYLSLVVSNEDNYTWLMYDEEFNLVSEIDSNIDMVRAAKSGDNYLYYINYSNNGSNKISKFNMYYLMTEEEFKYDNKDLVVRFSGEYDDVVKVMVNGVELDSNNYDMKSGSTVVTLKNDYLKSLKNGDYTLRVEYKDSGYAEAVFTIGDKVGIINPNTFDGGFGYMMMLLISVIGIVLVSFVCLKKRNS